MNTIDEVVEDVLASGVFTWDLECTSSTGKERDAVITHLAIVSHVAIASVNTTGCWDVSPEVLEHLKSLLTNPNLWGFVFNANYDHKVLHHSGILDHKKMVYRMIDLKGLVWMVDEEDNHGLKLSAKKFCNIAMTSFADVTKNSKAARKLREVYKRQADLEKIFTNWTHRTTPRRPWPEFSDEPKTRTAISKELRIADPSLKPAEAKERVAELFSDEHRDKYAYWVQLQWLAKKETIAKLEEEVNTHMKEYASDDASTLIPLYQEVMKILKQERTNHVIKVEMAVAQECIDMQIHGMPLDRKKLTQIGDDLREIIDELKGRVFDIAQCEFNINSPKEIRKLMYETFEVSPPPYKVLVRHGKERHVPNFTKTGRGMMSKIRNEIKYNMDCRDMSTIPEEMRSLLVCDGPTLERIDHPVAQAILDYRTAAKLLSTYVTGNLEKMEIFGDDRLHGEFNSWGTITGRFSSKDPNLQNIPSRGKSTQYHPAIQKKGPELREAFVAPDPDEISPEGYCLLVTDHSQIELRIIGSFAMDPGFLEVYREYVEVDGVHYYTGDVHSKTAREVGCDRKSAKSINFGFNYGMYEETYARQNKVFIPGTNMYDFERCAEYRAGYFRTYGGVAKLLDRCDAEYSSGKRMFTTIAGRYRHFYNADRVQGAERPKAGMILNSKVQGSAGDLLKHVIYVIRKYLYPLYPGLQLIGQVHDELIYVVPNKHKDEIAVLIKYCMEYPWFQLEVPVLASAKLSHSWGAKDDDNIPEIGTYYAEVDGEDRLFTADNWYEFLEADKAGLVTKKAACAQLLPEQEEWCRTIIPRDMPAKRPELAKRKVMSRKQMIDAGLV